VIRKTVICNNQRLLPESFCNFGCPIHVPSRWLCNVS